MVIVGPTDNRTRTYIWRFVEGRPIVNRWSMPSKLAARTSDPDLLSGDRETRRLKFVGGEHSS